MTIDDNNSVYVGGLPYDATEDNIRKIFNLYGSVVAVKIINDRGTRGKCYGFVTFTNPRSAVDAINDMNGRTIDGRVVRVNEVTTRGGKSNLAREGIRRSDWDRGRDRDRNYDRERDDYRDRYSDRSRERDRSRDHDEDRERGFTRRHDQDHRKERFLNGEQDQDKDLLDNGQEHGSGLEQISEREQERGLDLDQDKEIYGTNGQQIGVDENKDQHSRRHNPFAVNDRQIGELSSGSSDGYNFQVKEQLERSIQKREELKKEIFEMEQRFEEKQQYVLNLQEKSKNLEDSLLAAKKLSSHRQTQLTKLYECFLQMKDYGERFKSCEQELQFLVDSAMPESEAGDDGMRDGILTNGNS